jgi:hypothetical protein
MGKCPMRARNRIFKNKKRPTKYGGKTYDSDKSKQTTPNLEMIPNYICIVRTIIPKGEGRGLDPGTSPYPNALQYPLPTIGQRVPLVNPPKI